MYEQVEKPKENKSRAVANVVAQKKSNGKQGFGFVDNRSEFSMQRKNGGKVIYNSTAESIQRIVNSNTSNNKPIHFHELSNETITKHQQEKRERVNDRKNQSSSLSTINTIQAVFIFTVNPENYKLYDTEYFRVQGNKFMTGNKQEKHITADSVKDNLWTQMEGLSLNEFGKKVLKIKDEYQELPGMELIYSHKLNDEDAPIYEGLNQAMVDNYKLFNEEWDALSYNGSNLTAAISVFESAKNKQEKDAAAFILQNYATIMIRNIERFSDLMPFVNMISTIQKGGNERDAKKFLKTGEKSKNITNTNDALWAFFDFGAIRELQEGESILGNVSDSLPWINQNELADNIARRNGVEPSELSEADILEAVAGVMIGNHVRLIKLAYQKEAEDNDFGTEENITQILKANNIYINYADVASYAIYGFGT